MPKPKKPTRGGARPGAGRKPRGGALPVGTPQVRCWAYLTPEERDGLVKAFGSFQAAVADLAAKYIGT